MSLVKKLISRYKNHTFASSGTTGSDYLEFESDYKKVLKTIAESIDAQLVKFNENHYTFSAFVGKDGKYAYISIPDVRSMKNEWFTKVLVRKAKDDRDYSGGQNYYAHLNTLDESLTHLLK